MEALRQEADRAGFPPKTIARLTKNKALFERVLEYYRNTLKAQLKAGLQTLADQQGIGYGSAMTKSQLVGLLINQYVDTGGIGPATSPQKTAVLPQRPTRSPRRVAGSPGRARSPRGARSPRRSRSPSPLPAPLRGLKPSISRQHVLSALPVILDQLGVPSPATYQAMVDSVIQTYNARKNTGYFADKPALKKTIQDTFDVEGPAPWHEGIVGLQKAISTEDLQKIASAMNITLINPTREKLVQAILRKWQRLAPQLNRSDKDAIRVKLGSFFDLDVVLPDVDVLAPALPRAPISPRRHRATAPPTSSSSSSLPTVRLVRKIDLVSLPEPTLETVTSAHLARVLDQPAQVDALRVHLREVFKWKAQRYTQIQTALNKEKTEIELKSTQMGLGSHDRDKHFPQYADLFNLLFSIDAFLTTLNERIQTYASEDTNALVKTNFEQAIAYINEIQGDARSDVRNFIARLLYSLLYGPEGWINNFNNFLLLGSPGTGKTTAAISIAKALAASGVLLNDTVKIVSRPDLVAQYLGQTSARTRSALMGALDGIVFIDEAYQFNDDYGHEALTEMVNLADKYIGLLTIAAAGYEQPMRDTFLKINPGMPRRFPNLFVLPDYSVDDLVHIFLGMIKTKFDRDDVFSKRERELIGQLIGLLNDAKVFTNQAGDIANLASQMTQAIIGSVTPWGRDNRVKIVHAFNTFLEQKESDVRVAV